RAGGVLLGIHVLQQAREYRVRVRQLATEGLGRLDHTGADAVTQLLGSRVGEGHHQDFRGQQRPHEAVHTPLAEERAPIEGRNGEGLAGAGAGFDQAPATQWAAPGQWSLHAHADSSTLLLYSSSRSWPACTSG